ncbi:MAG: YdcF family protein [Gemmatimonas sp.]
MARRSPRRIGRILSRLFVVALTGWLAVLAAILVWSTRNSTEPADAIVVLGAAQYSGRPSPVLRARLDHALALWNAQRAPRMIFTGGRREGDVISEAAAGRRFAMRRGVPSRAILLEGAGRTSLASMHGAAVLLTSPSDSVRPPIAPRPRVLLVSDPFHMLRLDVLARMHGLTPLPSPTRTSPISANRSIALEYVLRESFALPADVAKLVWLYVTGHSEESVAEG